MKDKFTSSEYEDLSLQTTTAQTGTATRETIQAGNKKQNNSTNMSNIWYYNTRAAKQIFTVN